MGAKRVLLVHLTSNGDCLMATTVARQIKKDYQGCHLTWAISERCKQVIENNPFVDEIWSIRFDPLDDPHDDIWPRTKAEALRRQRDGRFDHVFFTQIYPENFNDFDGTTRSSIFRPYPGRITVPVEPVLYLFESEVNHVAQFASKHALQDYKNVVLFECSPASSQSLMTAEKAIRISTQIADKHRDTAIIISSNKPFHSNSPAIIDGSVLSFRENAELSKYCNLLLGCSSGISWLLTSNWAKKIPTIQFLHQTSCWYSFASMKYDHQFWGLGREHILETDVYKEQDIVDLVSKYLGQGHFGGIREVTFAPSIQQIHDLYRMRHGHLDIMRILRNFSERNKIPSVSSVSFYFGQLRYEVRWGISALARRALLPIKAIMSVLRRGADQIASRRPFR
jgi:ADP-heptose:LPS heptosyltransferase